MLMEFMVDILEKDQKRFSQVIHAKISMRLVPNQDWKEISDLFKQYVLNFIPKSVTAKIKTHHGAEPYVTPTTSII